MYYRIWLPLIENIKNADVIVFVQNKMFEPLEWFAGDTS